MTRPTLIEIARALEAKGLLPKGCSTDGAPNCLSHNSDEDCEGIQWFRDNIAAAILRDAMVMDCYEQISRGDGYWRSFRKVVVKEGYVPVDDFTPFFDSDHDNNPTLSLYAAWKWAKGTT